MICVTAGEPAGIGPDIIVRLAQQERSVPWFAIADMQMLRQRARMLQLPLELNDSYNNPSMGANELSVLHIPLACEVTPGQLNVKNVPGVMAALNQAVDGCLQGVFSALVTGPMQKSVVNDSGLRFSGHTEYLCERSGVDDVVMLLVAGDLRVALATTHLPLASVSASLTQELLTRRLKILCRELRTKFRIEEPRILVAGLNPHAGEQGHLGREELDVIVPVCNALVEAGFALRGPLPADTLFTPRYLKDADAVMAMYHDQGLPVLKYAGFGEAVNVTLGLPFVRTSVDHGTALDLAGSQEVSCTSMLAALNMAVEMSDQQRTQTGGLS